MRVLVVSHMYPGALSPIFGSFVADQVAALRKVGVDVSVVCPQPWVPPLAKRFSQRYRVIAEEGSQARIHEGVHVEPAHFFALPRNGLFWLGGPTLGRSLTRNASLRAAGGSFDLVHAHVILPDGYGAVRWGRRVGLPVICTVHGNDVNVDPHFSALSGAAIKWTIRNADAMIPVSTALHQTMCELETPKRSVVIPSGIDPSAFVDLERDACRASLGLPPDVPIALYVGSLHPIKGVKYLLGSFKRTLERVPNAVLAIVGEGPLREELEANAARLGIAGSIQFAGRQERSRVPTWMAAADVLVLPSENEGMPLVVLEAMASGLPVVASDVGGIAEALGEPAAGLLTGVGDEAKLADAISQILSTPALRGELSRRGRLRSVAFTWAANASSTLSLYQSVVTAHSPVHATDHVSVRTL